MPVSSDFSEPLQQVDTTMVLWRGRKLIYFAGCDYHRLSMHPSVRAAVTAGLDKFGLNVAASRKTTGNHTLYRQLECSTARFFASEKAIVVSSGYLANTVVAQALRGELRTVLYDERAHSSLLDAITTLGCRTISFRHLDLRDLVRKFARLKSTACTAILTDGLFAHSGAAAPLADYRKAVGPAAILWVDDAHAAGVVGATGRGSLELEAVSRRNVVQTVTFSKAFGAYGGAVLCNGSLARKIIQRSHALTGNTPLPLPLANAALAAIELFAQDPAFLRRLQQNVRLFWECLGLCPPAVLSPILAVHPASPPALQRRLLAAGLYPPLIRYPGGPEKGYFRFALSSAHSPEQIERLAQVLRPEFTRP